MLRFLKEKSMSGSEIVEEFERETKGMWKPVPGSIYPLLSWLQENNYTREEPAEGKIKRYSLTDKGEKFFLEQNELRKKIQKKMDVLGPIAFSIFWPEELHKLREPAMSLIRALPALRSSLMENPTEQAIEEVSLFLKTTRERLEKLTIKLGGESTV